MEEIVPIEIEPNDDNRFYMHTQKSVWVTIFIT